MINGGMYYEKTINSNNGITYDLNIRGMRQESEDNQPTDLETKVVESQEETSDEKDVEVETEDESKLNLKLKRKQKKLKKKPRMKPKWLKRD